MTDLRKAAEMALEALEEINKLSVGEKAICLPAEIDDAMEALRQALAESEQKPLVWMNKYGHVASFQNEEYKDPLYTAPPKREWEELDVNDVMGLIAEHITDPSPELMDKLYGLIAEADMLLQEKNSAREH